jgi:hypothetical protein
MSEVKNLSPSGQANKNKRTRTDQGDGDAKKRLKTECEGQINDHINQERKLVILHDCMMQHYASIERENKKLVEEATILKMKYAKLFSRYEEAYTYFYYSVEDFIEYHGSRFNMNRLSGFPRAFANWFEPIIPNEVYDKLMDLTDEHLLDRQDVVDKTLAILRHDYTSVHLKHACKKILEYLESNSRALGNIINAP